MNTENINENKGIVFINASTGEKSTVKEKLYL